MIKDSIRQDIQSSLKLHDTLRVSTLRLLSNALHNEEIAKQKDLTEEEELQIVRRQIKQRDEAVELYQKGGRAELVEKEQKEAEILKEFLPQQMSEEEIGRVMGAVMKEVAGKADGKTVAEVVKRKLQ